ncbi:hypothetical protein BJ508DRAFT_36100 [Ascobolus immersus RN42]|uniref:Uncharacterized protein n=1 Tax=Ascobolus immersus RN42 TaxID=1160509 RepID=A0A3N4HM63_ASCIM|nr:hypothetical protein BJ508DRAFT_36100 [Ascobolus immersus RN42]
MSETEPDPLASNRKKSPVEVLLSNSQDIVVLVVQQLDSLKTLNQLVRSHRIFNDAYRCAPYGILKSIVSRSFPREALYCLSLARQHALGGHARKYYIRDVGVEIGEKNMDILSRPRCKDPTPAEIASRGSSPLPIPFNSPNSNVPESTPEPPSRRCHPDEWVPNKFVNIDQERIGIAEAKWLVRADKVVEMRALACIRYTGSGENLQETEKDLQLVKTRIYLLYRLMAQFCWIRAAATPHGDKILQGVYDYTLACQLPGSQLQPLITLAEVLGHFQEKKKLTCPIKELLKDLQSDYMDTQPSSFSLLDPSYLLEESKEDDAVVPNLDNEGEPESDPIPLALLLTSNRPNSKWVFKTYHEIRDKSSKSGRERARETEILSREPIKVWKTTQRRRDHKEKERILARRSRGRGGSRTVGTLNPATGGGSITVSSTSTSSTTLPTPARISAQPTQLQTLSEAALADHIDPFTGALEAEDDDDEVEEDNQLLVAEDDD